MSSGFRLSEVHDVGSVAIITLRRKGYRVWWEASERPSADDWCQEGKARVCREEPAGAARSGGIVGGPRG